MRRKSRFFISIVFLGTLLLIYYCQINLLGSEQSIQNSINIDSCLSYYDALAPEWSNDFYDVNQANLTPAKDVIELVTRLTIFSQCLQRNGKRDKQRLRDIEKKLFPYIDFERLESDEVNFWHTNTRWNGEVHHASVLEFDRKDHHFVRSKPVNFKTDLSFWENWLHSIIQSGSRGIVCLLYTSRCV